MTTGAMRGLGGFSLDISSRSLRRSRQQLRSTRRQTEELHLELIRLTDIVDSTMSESQCLLDASPASLDSIWLPDR